MRPRLPSTIQIVRGLLLLLLPLGGSAANAESYLERAELRAFIDEMVARHDFARPALVELFTQVRPRPEIVKAISNPAEGKPWHEYRRIFLTESRIEGGLEFWARHQALLDRAEREFGVPAEIIVAIIGIETRYGRYRGKFPVIEALATLAFDYPKRSKFFRSELEQYLLLTREEGIDPMSLNGSYAGAMGGPQFISSSYRRYAVDFDGDGRRDLWESDADIIGSVANYFAVHGWRTGDRIVVPATVPGPQADGLPQMGLKPEHSVERLRQLGVVAEGEVDDDAMATVVALEQPDGHDYWLGLHNFYVITRYNHSALYAMAAYQLSREIAARRADQVARSANGGKG